MQGGGSRKYYENRWSHAQCPSIVYVYDRSCTVFRICKSFQEFRVQICLDALWRSENRALRFSAWYERGPYNCIEVDLSIIPRQSSERPMFFVCVLVTMVSTNARKPTNLNIYKFDMCIFGTVLGLGRRVDGVSYKTRLPPIGL